MNRGWVGPLILLFAILVPIAAVGQDSSEFGVSLRLGGVGDAREERLPFSPYLGVLGEAAPSPSVRLGIGYGFAMVSRPEDCVILVSGGACGTGYDLSPSARVSGQVRFEGGTESLRPFVEGLLGYDLADSSEMMGVGVGVRFPSLLFDDGLGLGVRRVTRTDEFEESYSRWELLAELRLVSHPW